MKNTAIVIDDSRTIRNIVKRALVQEGFEVILEAGDGQQALDELAIAGCVTLALVDWNMPVMNGFEFVGAIRAKPEFKDMRIMMVTTETEAGNVRRALDAGANEYVMKPFTPKVLHEKLLVLGLAKD
jgi:two-component system chemotaxis response regulator CheY